MNTDQARFDFEYPRSQDSGTVRKLLVGLRDTRAADDIRISYDFERDGWVIEQASKFEWPGDDKVCDPDWKEVAFVEAWARSSEAEHLVP